MDFKLENAIKKMREIRESRELRYGNGIFDKPLEYFMFMLQDKVSRLSNDLGVNDIIYETKLDTLLDIAVYSAIAYESLLDKAFEQKKTKINKLELRTDVNTGNVLVFFDGKYVGNTTQEGMIFSKV